MWYTNFFNLQAYEREGRAYTKKALIDLVKTMKEDQAKLGRRALRSKKKNFAAGLKALITSVVGGGSEVSEKEARKMEGEVNDLCDRILMTHFYYNGDDTTSTSKVKQSTEAAASGKPAVKRASTIPIPPPLPTSLTKKASAPAAKPAQARPSFLQDIKNLQTAHRVAAKKAPLATPTRVKPNFLSEISGSARRLKKTPLPRSPGGTPARQMPRRSGMASALEVAIAKRFSKIQVDSPMSDVSDFE